MGRYNQHHYDYNGEEDYPAFDFQCVGCGHCYDEPHKVCPKCNCSLQIPFVFSDHDCATEGCTFTDPKPEDRPEWEYGLVFCLQMQDYNVIKRCQFDPPTEIMLSSGTKGGIAHALREVVTGDRKLGWKN